MALPIEARNHAPTKIGTTLRGVAGLVELAGILVKANLDTSRIVHHAGERAKEVAKGGINRATRRIRESGVVYPPQK